MLASSCPTHSILSSKSKTTCFVPLADRLLCSNGCTFSIVSRLHCDRGSAAQVLVLAWSQLWEDVHGRGSRGQVQLDRPPTWLNSDTPRYIPVMVDRTHVPRVYKGIGTSTGRRKSVFRHPAFTGVRDHRVEINGSSFRLHSTPTKKESSTGRDDSQRTTWIVNEQRRTRTNYASRHSTLEYAQVYHC